MSRNSRGAGATAAQAMSSEKDTDVELAAACAGAGAGALEIEFGRELRRQRAVELLAGGGGGWAFGGGGGGGTDSWAVVPVLVSASAVSGSVAAASRTVGGEGASKVRKRPGRGKLSPPCNGCTSPIQRYSCRNRTGLFQRFAEPKSTSALVMVRVWKTLGLADES